MVMTVVGLLIVLALIAAGGSWLEDNPAGWFLVILVVALTVIVWRIVRKNSMDSRAAAMIQMADDLESVVADFGGVESYLALRKDEKVIYERGEVQLREYKGTGSRISSTYGGVNIRATKNVSFSVGGSDGAITPNPEEQTVIDVGTAIFTNQRILFAGPNHSREWEFEKLINLAAGDNGFVVDIAVSNRNKVSALAGDNKTGITPGIMATICVEMFQDGEEVARDSAMTIVNDIRAKAAEYRDS